MKILVGIPILTGYQHSKEAIESVVYKDDVELIIIDNGTALDIETLINSYTYLPNVYVIRNEENIYVNPAWNQIIAHFLKSNCDMLCIMNSDLLMQNNWADVLRQWYQTSDGGESYIPFIINDKREIGHPVDIISHLYEEVHEGTAGVFITLTQEQARMVYPIPDELVVWYGDNWIYTILRESNFKTIIPKNLIAFHGLSQTVSNIKGIDELIGRDTWMWNNKIREKINERIRK